MSNGRVESEASFPGGCKVPEGEAKRIVAVVEEFPNYLFHLLAAAEVGGAGGYPEAFRAAVHPDDLAYLKEHEELLVWGMGRNGALHYILVFIPAYLNLAGEDGIEEYFGLLEDAVSGNGLSAWFRRYERQFERLREWHFSPWITTLKGNLPPEYLEALRFHLLHLDEGAKPDFPPAYLEHLRRFGLICRRNYRRYHEEIWPVERERLSSAAEEIDARCAGLDFIGAWERLLGAEFRFNRHELVLTTTTPSNTDWNDLGYEQSTVYIGNDLDYILQMASHETGIRLVRDFSEEIFFGRLGLDPGSAWGPREALAEFYNEMVYRSLGLPYQPMSWIDQSLWEAFHEVYGENPDLTPPEVLERGIEAYFNKNGR